MNFTFTEEFLEMNSSQIKSAAGAINVTEDWRRYLSTPLFKVI